MPFIKGHLAEFGQIAPYLPLILRKSPLFLVKLLGLTQNQGKFEDFFKAFPGAVKAFLPLFLRLPLTGLMLTYLE